MELAPARGGSGHRLRVCCSAARSGHRATHQLGPRGCVRARAGGRAWTYMLYTRVKYVMYSLLSNLCPVRSSSRIPCNLWTAAGACVNRRERAWRARLQRRELHGPSRPGRRPARDGARGSILLTPHKVKANELLTTGSQSFPAPACRSSLPELPGRFQRHARGLAATLDVHVPLDRALLDLAPAILQLHELCVHDVLRVHLRGQVLGAGRR